MEIKFTKSEVGPYIATFGEFRVFQKSIIETDKYIILNPEGRQLGDVYFSNLGDVAAFLVSIPQTS